MPTTPPPPPFLYSGYPFKHDAFSTLTADDGATITYWVDWNGLSEKWSTGQGGVMGANAYVNWADAATFIRYAVGFTTVSGGVGSRVLNRVRPLAAPTAPNLYCDDIALAEYGGEKGPDAAADNWFKAGWAKYRLTFRAFKNKFLSDEDAAGNELTRYVTRTRRTNPREQKLPGTSVVFDDGTDRTVNTVAFLSDFEAELAYVWRQVPENYYPEAAIDSLLGSVNATTFDSRYPAETVLFKGMTTPIDPYPHPDGNTYVDLGYLFGYRPNGWNKARLPNRTWVAVKLKDVDPPAVPPPPPATVVRPYPSADLTALFKPSQS